MRFVDSLVLMAGGRVVFQGLPGHAPGFMRSLGHKWVLLAGRGLGV